MKTISRLLCFLMLSLTAVGAATAPADTRRVLVFSKTLGYRHDSIADGIAAIRDLGAAHQFAVEASEDSGAITATNLARFQLVVFLSVTGDVLNPEQEQAFHDYLVGGGGFAAVHGAVFGPQACEDKWEWYGGVFACAFFKHSQVLPATVLIEDAAHPANAGLPALWKHTDEWYNFTGTPRGKARVLATVDESTYAGGTMGADHPIAWCRQIGKGRMWYSAMGHTPQCFAEPLFLQHLLNGIQLAAGWCAGDFKPNARPVTSTSK
jgi:type 1 glutamine amidotransferase